MPDPRHASLADQEGLEPKDPEGRAPVAGHRRRPCGAPARRNRTPRWRSGAPAGCSAAHPGVDAHYPHQTVRGRVSPLAEDIEAQHVAEISANASWAYATSPRPVAYFVPATWINLINDERRWRHARGAQAGNNARTVNAAVETARCMASAR